MAEHHTSLCWRRNDGPFARGEYSPDHTTTFEGGQVIDVSAAAAFGGSGTLVDPEQLLLAALVSCHMLTFLAVAANRGLVIDAYDDDASCELGKDDEGRTLVTLATLRPTVRFAPGKGPTQEDFDKLHERAHRACFIANSVRSAVSVEPTLA